MLTLRVVTLRESGGGGICRSPTAVVSTPTCSDVVVGLQGATPTPTLPRRVLLLIWTDVLRWGCVNRIPGEQVGALRTWNMSSAAPAELPDLLREPRDEAESGSWPPEGTLFQPDDWPQARDGHLSVPQGVPSTSDSIPWDGSRLSKGVGSGQHILAGSYTF